MKRSSIVALAFAALPLLAEEPAKKPEPAAKPAQASQPAAEPDSPLVAAARRTNRLGKKRPANVITNATLTKSGSASAHVTTTETQAPLVLPPPLAEPPPTPEMLARAKAEERRKKDTASAEKKKKDTAAWEEKMKKAAERAEEGMYDAEEDPDYGDGDRDLEKAQSEKPPQV